MINGVVANASKLFLFFFFPAFALLIVEEISFVIAFSGNIFLRHWIVFLNIDLEFLRLNSRANQVTIIIAFSAFC